MPNNQQTDDNDDGTQDDTPENDSQEKEYITADQFEELKSDFNSVVGELKEERKKKREARERANELEEEVSGGQNQPDAQGQDADPVESKVRKVLQEERKEEIQRKQQQAEQEFKSAHSEFKDGADPGGIKYSAVEEQMQRFDLSDARTKQDFKQAYEDAYRLVRARQGGDSGDSYDNPYASDNNAAKDAKEPSESEDKLTQVERDVLDQTGWSKEKYLAQKEKRPSYVNSLLNQVS